VTPPARLSPAGRLLVLVAVIGTLFATHHALSRSLALRGAWPAEADSLYMPGARVLRALSLGHHELAADLIAARTNVYFGTQLAKRGEHRWLERYLTTALELDPHFHSLYRRGAAMLVYTGKEFSVDAFLAANRLLERGLEYFPSDWEIWFQLGFNLMFERGVETFRRATLLDGVPAWLPGLAAQMLTKRGGEALAIKHLEQTYAVTSDAQTRAEIRRKLIVLRGQHAAAELERGAAELRDVLSRAYPYAPEAFSLITGPRAAPGIDLPALVGTPSAPSP
jgi:tetratricopeptide (TPR) repeat protein